ncbi:MAG: hypothetical protein QM736_03490 [Vicinamibacterales bacterium]
MRHLGLALAVIVLTSGAASAQTVDSSGVPYRSWDIAFGGGFYSLRDADGGLATADTWNDGWQPSFTASVDVGRYWTSHLKTEAGITLLQHEYDVASQPIDVEGGLRGDVLSRADINRMQVGVGATWQFLDNAFVHPYVSAGARASVLHVDEVRDSSVWIWTGSGYVQRPVPPLSRRYVDVRVRPYVAVGSKSGTSRNGSSRARK